MSKLPKIFIKCKNNTFNVSNMRITKSIFAFRISKLLLVCIFIAVFIDSCQKEKSASSYTYLRSSTIAEVIPVASTINIFSSLSLIYPQSQAIAKSCLYDVSVYKVTYVTTFKNSPIVASGLICIPKTAGSYPLLSFQNGTNTKNGNAPSMDFTNSSFALVEGIASSGYVILMPDYIGFGASASILHPYHQRESNNSAIIDLIRASEEFLSSKPGGVTGNGKLYLMGYSQGGWATLSALSELEQNPVTTEQIQAASCGAGSYDLIAMTNYLLGVQTFPSPLYLPYFVDSHIKNGFMAMSLNSVFKEPYATRIPGLFNGMYDSDVIDAQLNDTISKFLSDSLLLYFGNSATYNELRNELVVNSVPVWKSTNRIFFAAGTADLDVPSFISLDTYNAFINLGLDTSQIKLSLYPNLDHSTALIPWGLETINWFNTLK